MSYKSLLALINDVKTSSACLKDTHRIKTLYWYFVFLLRTTLILIDFSLTVKAATLIFISGRVSTISSAKQGKSGSIYNLVKN